MTLFPCGIVPITAQTSWYFWSSLHQEVAPVSGPSVPEWWLKVFSCQNQGNEPLKRHLSKNLGGKNSWFHWEPNVEKFGKMLCAHVEWRSLRHVQMHYFSLWWFCHILSFLCTQCRLFFWLKVDYADSSGIVQFLHFALRQHELLIAMNLVLKPSRQKGKDLRPRGCRPS